jgi:hypothetical protein
MSRSVVRKLEGQVDGEPSGVWVQSLLRMS